MSVGSCSGTAAEWDLYNGAITGIFQLKNVSARLCLDNDGQPYSGTFNVKLKPCVFGSPQSLFLDAYGWP